MIGRRLFTAGLALATAIALTFLLLPLVAIFLRVPPSELFTQLGSEVVIDAMNGDREAVKVVTGGCRDECQNACA